MLTSVFFSGIRKEGENRNEEGKLRDANQRKSEGMGSFGRSLSYKNNDTGTKIIFFLNSNKGAYETKTNQLKLAKDELLAVFYSTTLVIYDELNIIINSIAT